MTQDPLMSGGSGIEAILQKLTSDQELDAVILREKVDLLARVAVDHLYEDACGNVISYKASAILGLAAHNDPRCRRLVIDYLNNYNLTLKRSALLAAKVLNDKTLCPQIAKLLQDRSTVIRMQAMDCLLSLSPENLDEYLKVLVCDHVWYVREKLARVLVQKGLCPDLMASLERDPKAAVREAAHLELIHS
ncbi:MAG: hypothetical protein MK132_22150 [Lentisphaerales bacterium]|nr:hypothetical protein [Lentisphaerales bacterium]